jgi:hypothetical protein
MKQCFLCLLALILVLAVAANSVSAASTTPQTCGAPTVSSTGATVDTSQCYQPGALGGVPICSAGCSPSTTACPLGELGSIYSCVQSSDAACSAAQAIASPTNAIAVSLLALTVSFDAVAIAFMLSRIFPHTGIKEWINKEYWEIAKSAMLIISIYAIISMLGNVAVIVAGTTVSSGPTATCTSGACGLVSGACTYLSTENTYMGATLGYLMGLSEGIGALQSVIVSAFTPIPLVYTTFKSGFSVPIYQNNMLGTSVPGIGESQSMLNDVLNILAFPLAFIIGAQLAVIPVLFVLGLAFLIPLGLILRAFPFVRGVGGTFIAIGIGISLVYPALLVLLNAPITSALQGTAFPSVGGANCSGLLCSLSGVVFSLLGGNTGVGIGTALDSINTIYPAMNGILYYSMYLMLQLFLFILDLTIAYPLVDNIARMLGSPGVRLSIAGKIKLA